MTAPYSTLHSTRGMVCSVDHLASHAGIHMLRLGGTAADAAVATSAVLAVTTQHMCGMGGDLFALVHHRDGSPPDGLDSAGRAGSGADPSSFRDAGALRVPGDEEIQAVTVPGCVDGWLALHERHGRLPIGTVLEPAVRYAADGFAASPLLAAMVPLIVHVDGADDYRQGSVRPGTLIRRPGVARTLEAIVNGGRDAFYEGEFGAGLRRIGEGLFTEGDLAVVQSSWVEPLAIDVWGHRVWTVPPTSQGYLNLAGAGIAERAGSGTERPDEADWVHLLVESAKLAGFDRNEVLFDGADGRELIAPGRLDDRARLFEADRRADVRALTEGGGTIHLCTADGDGMAVSLIQSNARGWGVHLAVPEVGIFLHNRGHGFLTAEGHPAALAPGKRPPHTLAPALVTRPDGSLRSVLGTMGGDSQPQIVLQMLARLLVANQSPSRTVGSGRFRLGLGGFDVWDDGDTGPVCVEDTTPPEWVDGLRQRGHDVVVEPAGSGFGHAHLIERRDDGVLAGASDWRALTGACATW